MAETTQIIEYNCPQCQQKFRLTYDILKEMAELIMEGSFIQLGCAMCGWKSLPIFYDPIKKDVCFNRLYRTANGGDSG